MGLAEPNVNSRLRTLLQELTGQRLPLEGSVPPSVAKLLSNGKGLGLSQFNELLLLFGYDRIGHGCFQFLVDGTTSYVPGASISSVDHLAEGTERFMKLAHLEAQALEAHRQEVVSKGVKNHQAYLVSDHLDVYVATSMRERHEFLTIANITNNIFRHEQVRDLKLRWFDPTQAYCVNRVDKGLAEALMLKRATCTLYLAQETDTLGKDSELASTLAQGKIVIAYVPKFAIADLDQHLEQLRKVYVGLSERDLILSQLRVFRPDLAWKDPVVQSWLQNVESFDVTAAKARLASEMATHYDKRARTLKDTHPLGVQVNLNTGVANGVLVVRTIAECAMLIRQAALKRLEFTLQKRTEGGVESVDLREKVSDCIYRVMTGDAMLTNAFWKFYLAKPTE